VVVAAGAMLLLATMPAEHAREDSLSAVLSMSASPPSSHYKSSLSALPASVASCIDPAVDPCDDFYSYACGGWVARTHIPADKPLIARSFDGAASEVHTKLRAIYETAYPVDEPFRALADFYASCINTLRLDELGAQPVKHMLTRIDGAASAVQLGDIIADFIASDIPGPIKLSVASAGGESKVLFVNGGGFILPDATFYHLPPLHHDRVFNLAPDPHAAERQSLENYYYQLNLLAGYSDDEAQRAANATICLETTMAH